MEVDACLCLESHRSNPNTTMMEMHGNVLFENHKQLFLLTTQHKHGACVLGAVIKCLLTFSMSFS